MSTVNPQLAPMKTAVQTVAVEKENPLVYHKPDEMPSFIGMHVVPHGEVEDTDIRPCTMCFEWAQLKGVELDE